MWVRARGAATRFPAFDVDGLLLHPDLLRLIPEDLALENRILPIHRTADLLFIAVPEGSPREGLRELEHLLGLRLELTARA